MNDRSWYLTPHNTRGRDVSHAVPHNESVGARMVTAGIDASRDAGLESARLARAFDATAAFSLGAEEEFMLVDPTTGELVPRAAAVLAACDTDDETDGGAVETEVVASVVESCSSICGTAHALEESLRAQRRRLALGAQDAGCALVSAGTHPFDDRRQPITDGDRYAAIARDYPWVVQEAATYGLHVHVGVQGADRAIAVCNALRGWLPHLLAISGSSPFLRGEATGLQSTRVVLAQLYPRSGIPPIFEDFADYARTLAALQPSGLVPDFSHTWWLARPHPGHGTVEVRVCDAQTDVRHAAALAALVQALVVTIDASIDADEPLELLPAVVCEENLWAAARSGCDGTFIDHATGTAISTRRALHRLLRRLTPTFMALDSIRYMPVLRRLVEGPEARRQLAAVEQDADLAALVRDLSAATIAPPLRERRAAR